MFIGNKTFTDDNEALKASKWTFGFSRATGYQAGLSSNLSDVAPDLTLAINLLPSESLDISLFNLAEDSAIFIDKIPSFIHEFTIQGLPGQQSPLRTLHIVQRVL